MHSGCINQPNLYCKCQLNKMWKFLLICVVMSSLYNESDAVARRAVRRRRGYAGSYAGGYANGGSAGGYTGGYNDYDDYGGGYTPYFGITDPYLFHQQLTNQILAQNYATQQRIQHQIAANSNRGGGGYNSHRYAPSYAAASGSIGSNGYRQTAYISPANPAQPNIVNRFGGSSSGGGGGYKGVSVSSFSTSNGDGTSRRGAQTTVNDNGKVTSYSVHS
ncbi:RNA-binding protein FUS isoform X2 [Drosophila grimshawi]|uniref:RNA-binding protein FUS isoform X2 n=1 Tax=Drosophila grimshawi TaxID=7222 RepID=UPI000C870D80|nr:RNA-binding protein FUS isoform X2 [Drosophila grimshawi]